MASLREQANIIRAIYNDYAPNDIVVQKDGKDRSEQLVNLIGGIQEVQLIRFLSERRNIFLSDFRQPEAIPSCGPGLPTTREGWNRRVRIATLFQSCKDAKLIEPFDIDMAKAGGPSNVVKAGVRITDKGLDLLGFFGFCSIFLDKHSRVLTFLWGIIAGTLGTSTLWIITHPTEVFLWFGLLR